MDMAVPMTVMTACMDSWIHSGLRHSEGPTNANALTWVTTLQRVSYAGNVVQFFGIAFASKANIASLNIPVARLPVQV